MEVKLTNVRLSFPDLWVPKEFSKGDGKPRFSASFLIEPGSDNDKAVREAIKTEATAVLGAKAASYLKQWENNTNRYCYTDGSTREYDGYEGMMCLASHTAVKPLVIDRDKSPLTAAEGRPYAGCYVNAKVSVYAQKGENGGIRCSFSGVQFAKDGDAFTSGRPANPDDFDEIADGADAGDIC